MGDSGRRASCNDVLHKKSSNCVDEKGKPSQSPRSSSCKPSLNSCNNNSRSAVNLSSSKKWIDRSRGGGGDALDEKEVLLQHHHDLSNLCRDLEQHKLDMQRQHVQLAEALKNLGAGRTGESTTQPEESGADASSRHHRRVVGERGDKLRVRKEGRDEHGMNGASSISFAVASSSSSPTVGNSGGASSSGVVKRDIWDEELVSGTLEDGHITEIPELTKSVVYSSGLPPRTIPFRSASFSQVDITSEGKYVRNPRSPITLKPTAFCLMNNSYASGSSTLPRAHVKQQHHRQHSIMSGGSFDEDHHHHQPLSPDGLVSPPMLSHQESCESDCGSSGIPHFHQFILPETISEQSLVDVATLDSTTDKVLTNGIDSGVTNMDVRCEESRLQGDQFQCDSAGQSLANVENTVEFVGKSKNVQFEYIEGSSMPRNSLCTTDSSCDGENKGSLQVSNSVESEISIGNSCEENMPRKMDSIELDGISFDDLQEGSRKYSKSSSTDLEALKAQDSVEFPKLEGEASSHGGATSPPYPVVNVQSKSVNFYDIPPDKGDERSSKNLKELSLHINRQNKPQLVRSPPLIREESIMARSSSEEGPKSDQDEEHAPSRNILVSNMSTESSSTSNEKSLPRPRKGNKKHVLLELDIGGGSSISGSGGEDDPDKDKHGLFRQSSGQSDESAEGDRQSDGCTSPPITASHANPATSLPLHHRSHLSAGNSPLTEALALDSPVRRGSTSSPATAPTAAHSATNLHSTSLPQTSSVSGQTYFKGPSHNENCLSEQRESDRVNSLSSPNVNRQMPPRRYNKRPLRGPYGEMLEAEMTRSKLVPSTRSNREYDNLEFWRESKSSSPSRTTQNDSESISSVQNRNSSQQTPKLASTYLMSSMDDLNLTKQKHSSTRSRKISANLPVTHYHTKEDGAPIAFHQRTASSPSQLLYAASSSDQDTLAERRQLDASPRGHVLAEIVETEKSYVDSLRILVKKYMEPLKQLDIIDNGLVDEIFFQIPSILRHHEQLLDDLQRTVTDDQQCVGNVFLDTFRKSSLLDCYSLFVNNWKNAKGSLKMALASKPQLARFLEAQARQHKGKLSVDSLLIMPIQRIPRYELLLKELLKHTEATHEDHSRLMLALEKIKKFAVHIDCASVDPNGSREIEIEGWGSGLGHLVRQDVVTLCSSSNVKKERALFLFADSLVVASIKRKSTMRKPPQGHNSANSLDGCKFKLLMKIQLTDVHIVSEEHEGYGGASGGGGGSGTSGGGGGSSNAGGKSASGSSASSSSHHSDELDDLKTIHKMMDLATLLKCPHVGLDEVLRELASGLKHHCDNNADVLDIEIKAGDNSDTPEALKILFGSSEKKNAWVDSFQDTLGKFIRYGFGKLPQVQFVQALPIRKTRAGLQLSCAAPVTLYNKASKTLEMTDLWVANSDGYVGQICILTLHPEPAITSCNGVCNSRITCIIAVPPPSYPHLAATSYHESFSGTHDSGHHSSHHPIFHSLGYESEDDHHRPKPGQKALSEHWSVWLGTEDGSLHVYDCSDSIRVKKNRHKVQHKSPMNCMVFFDRRVFVALGNGDVAVYNRNPNGKGWLVNDASWVTIGTAMNPVTKMICVKSFIWCACGSQIKIYSENGGMLELIQTIQIVVEGNQMPRGVSAMVAGDQQVWIAVQATSIIKCYSTTTYECITEINVGPDVVKILAGCDDIIKQHKSATLRVTALLVAPDKSLWIGTSAGVLLTISSSGQNPKISPLCHGHTGQVRFLTCCVTRDSWTVISGGDGYEEFRSVPAFLGNTGSSFSSMVTGLMGESAGDLSGREDSTNHLLIWKIPKLM